ncbi:hypothetical protein AMELA_G00057660 [Ameiurus melas]|uniref:C-C motif chemokine n=1 Tax=Ameiurus melas TaxID=219545 RepID=A0A7J6B151_AMEME|nr:hypothetical protein AMELA_G00057660 [Ameiurus melas]
MFSHSLLLVLLGLTCLQSFTTAQNAVGPYRCCFIYQTHKIPVKLITAYNETDRLCPKPGVIFTVKNGQQTCANPDVEWVKNHMKTIDQRSTQTQTSV